MTGEEQFVVYSDTVQALLKIRPFAKLYKLVLCTDSTSPIVVL